MKILYMILPLWFLVALPLMIENSIFRANNQFETYKQAQETSPKREKNHRGSGR